MIRKNRNLYKKYNYMYIWIWYPNFGCLYYYYSVGIVNVQNKQKKHFDNTTINWKIKSSMMILFVRFIDEFINRIIGFQEKSNKVAPWNHDGKNNIEWEYSDRRTDILTHFPFTYNVTGTYFNLKINQFLIKSLLNS